MSGITVHYFDAFGRAEMFRLLLTHSRTQFTDHRLSFEEWGKLKAEHFAEFDQLPVIEVDGLKLAQSVAAFRYLGRKLGYLPTDPLAEYKIDSLFGLREDFINGFVPVWRTKDQEALQKWFVDNSPKYLGYLEARLTANNDGAGWFVGDSVTLADIMVFEWIWDSFKRPTVAALTPLLDSAPKVKAFFDRMLENSAELRAYYESREEKAF